MAKYLFWRQGTFFCMLLNPQPTEVFLGPFSRYAPVLVTMVIAWDSGAVAWAVVKGEITADA